MFFLLEKLLCLCTGNALASRISVLSMEANPNTERKRMFPQLVNVIWGCQCTSKPCWDRSNPEWQASLSPLCQSTKAMTAPLFFLSLKSEKQNNPVRSWQCFGHLVSGLATTAPGVKTGSMAAWESCRWLQKCGAKFLNFCLADHSLRHTIKAALPNLSEWKQNR